MGICGNISEICRVDSSFAGGARARARQTETAARGWDAERERERDRVTERVARARVCIGIEKDDERENGAPAKPRRRTSCDALN